MAVTLKDVAREVGLSHTAVSHVLNGRLGHVRVSASKQDQVRQVARELGYVPHRAARSMVRGRSLAIGVVGSTSSSGSDDDDYGGEYFIRVVRGVESVCRGADYNCLLATSQDENPEAFQPPRAIRDGSVDGVVLIGHSQYEMFLKLKSLQVPFIQVGSNVDPGIVIDRCYADLDTAFAEVSQRFGELGHESIELILPEGPGPDEHARQFEAWGERAGGLKVKATILAKQHSRSVDAECYAEKIADGVWSGEGPTAFIVGARHCVALARGLFRRGLICPRDYSLVGFGTHSMLNQYLVPDAAKLSMIVLPAEATGRRAAERLLSNFDTPPQAGQPIVQDRVPCEIVFQESVGPYRPRTPMSRGSNAGIANADGGRPAASIDSDRKQTTGADYSVIKESV